MAVKQLLDHHLFQVKDAAKGFLIPLKASSRYSPGYLDCLEETLGQLAFAEEESWPAAKRQVVERILERGLFLSAQALFEPERIPMKLDDMATVGEAV